MVMMANMMTMVADTVAMKSSHVLKKLTYYGNGIMKSRSVICHVHWCIRSEVWYTSRMSKCTVHLLSYSLSLRGAPCLKNQTCEKVKVKVFNFYLQALSSQAWSPKGRRSKEDTLPAEQQVGLEPGTFLFMCRVECLKCLAPVLLLSCHSQEVGCVTLQPSSCHYA